MQTFKRILLATVGFIFILTTVSAIVIEPWRHSESNFYMAAEPGKELAGTLNCLVVGASQGLHAFMPEVLNEKMNCNSYNLSIDAATMHGRFFLAELEIKRNPIDTVILDISHDAIGSRTYTRGSGDARTLCKLGSWRERLTFLIKYVPFDDWLNIYSRDLLSGLAYWQLRAAGNLKNEVDYSAKGYCPSESVDVTLSAQDIVTSYNASEMVPEFAPSSLERFKRLVDMCKQNGCRVIITTVPLSDAAIWKGSDWDEFYTWLDEFCGENNCEHYDFNLLKERFTLWSDKSSFLDELHMGTRGAEAFSEIFAEVVNKAKKGEDVSSLFYGSYEEMKKDSPYMKIYQNKE